MILASQRCHACEPRVVQNTWWDWNINYSIIYDSHFTLPRQQIVAAISHQTQLLFWTDSQPTHWFRQFFKKVAGSTVAHDSIIFFRKSVALLTLQDCDCKHVKLAIVWNWWRARHYSSLHKIKLATWPPSSWPSCFTFRAHSCQVIVLSVLTMKI